MSLILKGESSISDRQVLQECIDYIHWKQKFYEDILTSKKKYYSYLITIENDD